MSSSIQKIPNGGWRQNCYLIFNDQKEALIIDPGSDESKIVEEVTEKGLNTIAILNTHAHYDHVGAVESLKQRFQIPFYLHSGDQKLLKQANLYRQLFGGSVVLSIPEIDYYFDELKKPLRLGSFLIKIIHTPGHTVGSCCLLVDGYLFTGDTLFKGKVGRTDLPGGNAKALGRSLVQLRSVQRDAVVCPGHGKTSVVHEELKNNQDWLNALSIV